MSHDRQLRRLRESLDDAVEMPSSVGLTRWFGQHLGPAWAAEPEKITFASNNSKATALVGYLFRPIGAGPFPAVVALHGCGGLFTKNGRLQDRNVNWADHLTAAGIAVLFPDSFNPRGVSQVCTLKEAERPVVPFGRSFDANGAADWLATQPFIDRTRLGLLGWSHGGSVVLWSVRGGAKPRITDFKTAIAFYPGCRVHFESPNWAPRLPLKILMGTADDWTPPALPRSREEAQRADDRISGRLPWLRYSKLTGSGTRRAGHDRRWIGQGTRWN